MDTVQALRGDPDSSEAEHARIMLVQTEVERVKFVVRSYIRTRLHKARIPPLVSTLLLDCDRDGDSQIEKFSRYIVATPEVQERLSQTELDHAKRCVLLFTTLSFAVCRGLTRRGGPIIQVLSVDREPFSRVSPTSITTSSAGFRRQHAVHAADEYVFHVLPRRRAQRRI